MQAQAKQNGELLLVSPPPNWRLAHQDRQGNVVTTEYIPLTQKIESWKELITVQIMLGMENADPEDYLGKMVTLAETACENLLGVRVIPFTQKSTYPTVGVIQGCGKNKENLQGEFTLIRAISGKDNLYVIRKAWRLPIWNTSENPDVTDDEILRWLEYLASARVCDTRGKTCPAQTGNN